jgi:Ran GTPase-activating protein (RanGAP) involved in mRNA processing and transport
MSGSSSSSSSSTESDSDPNPDSMPIYELCHLLRANDPRVLTSHVGSTFIPYNFLRNRSEARYISVFRALKKNTSVKSINFTILFERHYTERCALVTAEYVESSKTLRTLRLCPGFLLHSHEVCEMISHLLRALSRNTSVTKLIISIDVVLFASVAFQELLTCTQTLRTLQMDGSGSQVFNGAQTAAIVSGFANNTTLRDLEFNSWRDADLAPVLTALQDHPVLQEVYFRAQRGRHLPRSLSGLGILLRSQNSKVKELILEHVDSNTVGLHSVFQELGRNTIVTNFTIRNSGLSRESVQQVKSMLRQTTTLQSLDLTSSALGSAGLAEIVPVLYRNTSIKTLDLSSNGLQDIESANVLRELIRRNKTITSLCLTSNTFGRNAAAVRSIFEGLRSNTALQQLDLGFCALGDQGVSLLANALVTRNGSMLQLDLHRNQITSVGVRALVEIDAEAVKTLTKLDLRCNPVESEGATILANALVRNTMPDLTQLNLMSCGILDDGFVALVSALEQNTTLRILDLTYNLFLGARGFMALAVSLPNIKGLQQINIAVSEGLLSTLPFLMEGFRNNTSLVEVDIDEARWCLPSDCSKELKCLGYRNRFTPLLKARDPSGASPWLGIWSRALAKVATEPDVLFHVLRNKPKLVGSAGGSNKRKRDGE